MFENFIEELETFKSYNRFEKELNKNFKTEKHYS